MCFKLLKNDFRKNPVSNLILFLFMSLSVTIAVTVTIMLTQLFTSITDMYETANPPHFLQMHKGELVQADIDEFNKSYEGIEHWQTVTMITVNGDTLTVYDENKEKFSLSDCRLDISLVKQNDEYDVLLDENRNKSEIKAGEIGVPVILLDEFDIALGDKITLSIGDVSKAFTVASYVYDGQMNSTLCSSTRFLISDEEFNSLLGNVGETEYLIEAYFTDSSLADDYQTAYEQSEKNLPKNGQAITYTMIFLLSALTDLIMAMVFMLTGVLLIAIAVVCLRYVVLAQLEGDMREIGTMKAIGIPQKGICRLYLGKIRILMAAGCVTGYVLALLSSALLTERISRTFGEQPFDMKSFVLAVLVCVVVYAVILLFSRKILGRLQRASVTDLLVTEKGFGKTAKTVCSFSEEQAEKHTYYINIPQSANAERLIARLRTQLTCGYSIENMEEFVGHTLGGVSSQVKQSAYAVFFIGIGLTVLIVTLFMKLRIARQGGALAAKRAMGIPFTAICRQELYPVLIAGGLGTLAGAVLAEIFGGNMISVLFEMLGVGLKRLEFAGIPFLQYLVIPVLLLAVLTVVTYGICRSTRKIKIESYFND